MKKDEFNLKKGSSFLDYVTDNHYHYHRRSQMKKIIIYTINLILLLTLLQPNQVLAYSYGDPGEEKIAEAYKQLKQYVENDEWDEAKQVINNFEEDFELYFAQTKPYIDEALENKDKELLLRSYRVALRLNLERRFHFAKKQFDDYGQAKLLLAKARGTFNVLEPYVTEELGEETTANVYSAFDTALDSLGNPGLFGIGNKDSDKDLFLEQATYINEKMEEVFQLPVADDGNDPNLSEENLNPFQDDLGASSPIWKWISVALVALFILLVVVQRMKKRRSK